MTREALLTEAARLYALLWPAEAQFVLPETPADWGFAVVGDGPHFHFWRSDGEEDFDHHDGIDGEEALYLAFDQLTARAARAAEAATRSHKRDLRARFKQMFNRSQRDMLSVLDDYSRQTWMMAQQRLMGALRPGWGVRLRLHHEEMLAQYPLTPHETRNFRRLDLSDFGL